MTIEQIEALDREMLIPSEIAEILGCNSYAINVAAKKEINPFPFPLIRLGNRVKIPRRAFLKAMKGE